MNSRAARALGPAILAAGLALPIACGARDAGDWSYLYGAGGSDAGSGGPGPSTSGPGASTSGPGSGAGGTSSGPGTGAGGAGGTSSGSGTGAGGAGGVTSSTGVASSSSTGDPPMPVTVIALPQESGYLYWDKGSVAANWSDPGFDDSSWSKGVAPLGYGDPHINTQVGYGPSAQSKYITTWCRTTFDVKNAGSVIAATLELLRDDGARAFLNGVEVARSNLPDGAISADTEAIEVIQGPDETDLVAFAVSPDLLVEGQNWLAIEVHQAVANSSDLAIDARVTLEQLGP